MKDKRLEKIRKKDPIIATYPALTLLNASKIVDETYSEHALTHISIGNIYDYLQNLLRWVKINKGCAAGAIVGPIGYGKTSTAVHFWKECEDAKIVSIPPVSWRNFEELFNGIYGWVKYKLEKSAPSFNIKLDEIYKKYRKKSLEEISQIRQIPLSKLKEMLKSGQLVLGYKSKEIIDYLDEITNLILSAKFEGLMIFLDELQITLEEYPTRDKFMNDIFMLVNELLTRNGKYGIIFCMPTNTEILIADIRKDIIQRLQKCNIYIRADTIYDRKFPLELWEKYSYLYKFKDIKSDIIPECTLDAIGQISSREDLGAGPRTVIDTFIQAINYYDISKQPYTPINLIDDYLTRKIAFVAGGKIVNAVSKAINIPFVKEKKERINTIKLLSSYPSGCPDEIIKLYNLENTVDELVKKLYGEVLMKTIEGYTLQGLLEERRPTEPHFIRITRDFINRYSEDRDHADMARKAFIKNIIDKIFEKRRPQQIIGWDKEGEINIYKQTILRKLKGTFNYEFPYRMLNLVISSYKSIPDIQKYPEGINLVFHLDWNCDREYPGYIEFDEEINNKVIIRLNLIQYSKLDINIPYLARFFSMDKISPMFMLSLLNYLDKESKNIPTHEIEGEMKIFTERLITYSNQMLLSNILRETSKVPLKFVGEKLIEEIFNNLCKKLFPEYKTFITSYKWQLSFKSYLTALRDERIGLRVARGRISFRRSSLEIANIFGVVSVLAFKTFANSIRHVLRVEVDKEYIKLKFLYHPLEEKILDWIRSSTNRIQKKESILPCLYYADIFENAKKLGYEIDEIAMAIDLLKNRKHIYFDKEEKLFYEVPVSIEEKKDDLIKKINDLQEYVKELKDTGLGFDDSIYEEKISKLTKRVEKTENEEDCEIIQEEINVQFKFINGFIHDRTGKITSDLSDINRRIQSIILHGTPKSLTKDIESNVPWVSDLNELRNMILNKYNISLKNLNKLALPLNNLLETWHGERFGVKDFINFYKSYIELKNKIEDCFEEIEISKNYFSKFENWSELLRKVGNVFSDAQVCNEMYKNPVFLKELEKIFTCINVNFEDKKLESLVDYEIFSIEIEKVGKNLEDWKRIQRQTFNSEKERYQEKLQVIQISERMLRTTFDPYDPSGSFERLHKEVYEKCKEKLGDITENLKYFESEILYSINILDQDLSELKEDVDKIKKQFRSIKKQFLIEIIKNIEEFDSFCNQIKQLNENVTNIEKNLRGVITVKRATIEEEEILQIIKDPNGEDLKNVIIKFAEKNPERFNLSSILKVIENLFKKNQIRMKIFKRR